VAISWSTILRRSASSRLAKAVNSSSSVVEVMGCSQRSASQAGAVYHRNFLDLTILSGEVQQLLAVEFNSY
jgi:hypothetical protein